MSNNVEIVYNPNGKKYKNFLRIILTEGTISIPLINEYGLSPDEILNNISKELVLDEIEVSMIPIIKEYPILPTIDKSPYIYPQNPTITWTCESKKDEYGYDYATYNTAITKEENK